MQDENGNYVDSPVHEWFSLTYAHWLTLPRVIMEAMPYQWQLKMKELLEELDKTYDWIPDDTVFYVTARKNGKLIKLSENLCNYRHPNNHFLDKIKQEV